MITSFAVKEAIVLKSLPIDEQRIVLTLYTEEGYSYVRMPHAAIHAGDLGIITLRDFEVCKSPARRWFHDRDRTKAITHMMHHFHPPEAFLVCHTFLDKNIDHEGWERAFQDVLSHLEVLHSK